MKHIKVSVITVCYNAEKFLENTILSVLEQEYKNIEYIIIDGNSKDSSVQIIEKYCGVNKIKWITEADEGIYDAMNKGIRFATGDYVQFLNAGDTFYDKLTVKKVVDFLSQKEADVYYGHIIYQYPSGHQEVRKYGKWCGKKSYFFTGDCLNHQSLFVRRQCFEREIFNVSYKICADREWMMRMNKDGFVFQGIDLIICNYLLDSNSASIKEQKVSNIEADRCVKMHFPWGYVVFKLFTFMRKSKFFGKILHGVYRILFMRKEKM